MSAIIGDRGEPMGVPKICLYIILLKVKNVESIIKFKALMKCSIGIFVLFAMNDHLLFILSTTNSVGPLIKSETTSSDAKEC